LEATVLLGYGPVDVNAAASVPPTATAVVSKTDRDVPTSEADLLHTALDDVHTVDPEPLPPTRLQPLGAVSPALEPSTVTLTAPVEGPFEDEMLLEAGPTEKAFAKVPTDAAAVNAI
jgi:hypothetical protein